MNKAQLYFCYGDDMDGERMRAMCPSASFVCIARLPGYRLEFVGHSKRWDGGEEALVNDGENSVWGVVYRLGYTDGDTLDAWKDIRLNGTGLRFHYLEDVFAEDGTAHSVLLYQKSELGKPTLPSREYLDAVISGAASRGLPATYVDGLRRVGAKSASYPVPRKTMFDVSVLAGLSCDCGENA